MGKRKKAAATPQAESYRHSDVTAPMRPDVGTQAQFRKKKPPATYRYDSSLSPALEWDDRNHARDEREKLIARLGVELQSLRAALARGILDTSQTLPEDGGIESRCRECTPRHRSRIAAIEGGVRRVIA